MSALLPVAACHVLGHPDFTADLATITWIDHEEPQQRRVAIRCGPSRWTATESGKPRRFAVLLIAGVIILVVLLIIGSLTLLKLLIDWASA